MSPNTVQPLEPPRVPRATPPIMLSVPHGALPSSVTHGDSAPIGATVLPGGVNFSVFSRTARAIDLLLFDKADDARPAKVIPLDPVTNRTYQYWHTFVPTLRPGQIYGYRAAGPFDPRRGLRFCAEKVLLDPYGRGVAVPDRYDRETGKGSANNTAAAM